MGKNDYKFHIPFFVCHFMFHKSQLTMRMIFFFFFSIFNSSYFIRKVKSIHGKLLLVEHRVVHKKWHKEFVFPLNLTTLKLNHSQLNIIGALLK